MKYQKRNGTAAILICLLLVPLLGLFALSVDYGFLLYVKSDLQKSVDQVALAAAQDLVPDMYGNQDIDKVKETIRSFVEMNLGDGFVVLDEDIEIGRFDPSTIYSQVDMLDSGIFDTVRVTVRRDSVSNNSVSLYFARVFGATESNVSASATAVLQKGRYIGPGTAILPIGMDITSWDQLSQGEISTIYGDGKVENELGHTLPGNWGTLDVGAASNSTSDLVDQILNGISQDDLDDLEQQGVITHSEYIDSQDFLTLNGDTGFSAGIKQGLDEELNSQKLLPIYNAVSGHGGSVTYEVIGWGVINIVQTHWNGGKNSKVEIQKGYMYDKHLIPVDDLSNITDVIQGAYTSPVLVE